MVLNILNVQGELFEVLKNVDRIKS